MVFIGGITRLTESCFSITEWIAHQRGDSELARRLYASKAAATSHADCSLAIRPVVPMEG